MRTFRRLVATASLVLGSTMSVGCGGAGGSDVASHSARVGPHGGPVVPLPAEGVYAEIVLEAAKKGTDVQVVAYGLNADLTGAAAPLPEGVSVDLAFPDRAPETIPLAPEPKPGSKAAVDGGRLASRPGPYSVDPLSGTITGTLQGKAFSEKFASPR